MPTSLFSCQNCGETIVSNYRPNDYGNAGCPCNLDSDGNPGFHLWIETGSVPEPGSAPSSPPPVASAPSPGPAPTPPAQPSSSPKSASSSGSSDSWLILLLLPAGLALLADHLFGWGLLQALLRIL